jgi:hypothetical protein
MGLRFRRSFRVMPGWRVNLSRSGLSSSFETSAAMVHHPRANVQFRCLICLLGIAGHSHAAGSNNRCDVPRAFEGRTYFFLDSGRQTSESLDIEVTSMNSYGIFTGTFSRYSPFPNHPEVLCQEAVRVPVEGFYNGYELSLHVKESAKNSICRDFNWRFTRRPDGSFNYQGDRWRIELTAVCKD